MDKAICGNNTKEIKMSYGVVEYDINGLPICEICKKPFIRVLNHARYKHNISAKEYKIMFGLDLKKGICSIESSKKSREHVYNNFNKVVKENLLKKGVHTQFKEGSKGRTKDKLSEQTRLRLTKRFKENNPLSKEEMIEKGRLLGKSGLGNKVRWSKG